MLPEIPVAIEVQAQIFHAGPHLDADSLYSNLGLRWRLLPRLLEKDSLGFMKGHRQPQGANSANDQCHPDSCEATDILPRVPTGQDKSVVRIADDTQAREESAPEYTVVPEVPQDGAQN